jgi:hypothetical protein
LAAQHDAAGAEVERAVDFMAACKQEDGPAQAVGVGREGGDVVNRALDASGGVAGLGFDDDADGGVGDGAVLASEAAGGEVGRAVAARVEVVGQLAVGGEGDNGRGLRGGEGELGELGEAEKKDAKRMGASE